MSDTDFGEDKSFEQRAFEDLDVIAGLADAALVAHSIGKDEDVDAALEKIKSISESWSDPDHDAFEDYEFIPPSRRTELSEADL